MITYEIEGTPRPQGSKRHLGNGVMIESSRHVREWRALARMKAVEAMQGRERFAKPHAVRLRVTFGFGRPKKHFKKGVLRPDAPTFHVTRPDADKLLRALLDSMSEVVFEDDSQAADIKVKKVYSKGAVTSVTVVKVTNEDSEG